MQNKATQLEELSFKFFIHGEAGNGKTTYIARTIIIPTERDELYMRSDANAKACHMRGHMQTHDHHTATKMCHKRMARNV